MKKEQADKLREPFDKALVGKLPRTTCRDCAESPSKVCGRHHKSKCQICGAWITDAHMHLDYVGHAAVTERLLQVDPDWTWEPMTLEQDGTPRIINRGRDAVMWIRLTVGGVRRIGAGIVSSTAVELEKQLISDAIRNAAMRFGVALDLWSKEGLGEVEEPPPAKAEAQSPGRRMLSSAQRKSLWETAEASGWGQAEYAAYLRERGYSSSAEIPVDEFDALLLTFRMGTDEPHIESDEIEVPM